MLDPGSEESLLSERASTPDLLADHNVLFQPRSLRARTERATLSMHDSLLGTLAAIWKANGLLGSTADPGFTPLPQWSDDYSRR